MSYSESSFWLQRGDNFLRNVSNLLSTLNFTEMRSDINRILDAAHNAIAKVVDLSTDCMQCVLCHSAQHNNILYSAKHWQEKYIDIFSCLNYFGENTLLNSLQIEYGYHIM